MTANNNPITNFLNMVSMIKEREIKAVIFYKIAPATHRQNFLVNGVIKMMLPRINMLTITAMDEIFAQLWIQLLLLIVIS